MLQPNPCRNVWHKHRVSSAFLKALCVSSHCGCVRIVQSMRKDLIGHFNEEQGFWTLTRLWLERWERGLMLDLTVVSSCGQTSRREYLAASSSVKVFPIHTLKRFDMGLVPNILGQNWGSCMTLRDLSRFDSGLFCQFSCTVLNWFWASCAWFVPPGLKPQALRIGSLRLGGTVKSFPYGWLSQWLIFKLFGDYIFIIY